ncbi:MAG: tetratricopeptide repeat protein [Nonlabens sp.]|uniref:tetratricopeptide repeat protein n=1 Tax=Nonlabens sp. TaxID=1888209 RepID=UPI003EF77C92
MRKIVLTLLIAVTSFIEVNAQQSKIFTDHLRTYNQAIDLYQEQQYTAAQRLFEKVKDQVEDDAIQGNAAYYIANCAVRLNQRNADALMEAFVEEYPTSTKRNTAFIDVADYYFDNGKYTQATKWYKRVDVSTLSRKQQNKYYFNTGYTLVQSKKYEEAKPFLNRVSDDPEYGSEAKFYLGYIAYEGDDYQEANDRFNEAGTTPEADEKLSYYQADLNYKLGNFDKAIALAKEQMSKSNPKEQSELNRIIGQSLFNQEKYDEALPYLQEYKGVRGRWNNNDYYQLGYTYYKQGNFEKAIETFNKIVDGENKTAQNAYYHLAQSYIKLGKSEDALNAFKKASEMDFDAQIQEDATYNYAKISYEYGNPFDSVPAVILNYLETYPATAKKGEMNEYLIDSYFSSKNYTEAMRLMEDGRIAGNEDIYAKVALYEGLNQFKSGDYKKTIQNLNKTIQYAQSAELKKRATFWKAQSNYELNNFPAALTGFNAVKNMNVAVEEDQLLNYDLAYTQFKLKDYASAIATFTTYTKQSGVNSETARLNDAYLRIGDANFVTKQYWPAMEAYNKSISMNGFNADYAAFQKAISYGFVGKNDRKIEDLNAFLNKFKTSAYRDDVMYELGNTYINTNNVNKGIQTYDRLINEFPQSSYTSQAMMRKGLQLYNDSKLDAALVVFKDVVAKYPGTPQANEAVSSARLIYVDQNRTNDYAAWVRTLDFVDVSDSELDDTAYESAEQPYLQNDMAGTARSMKKYLAEYPNGKHALQAHFYLAQALFSEDKKQESIPSYEYVISKERSEFTEQALARLSGIYLGESAFAKAIPVLTKLEQLADFPQNIIYAQSNLMKAYYELEDYDKAVSYANKVLADATISDNVRSDANVIIARSNWKRGNEAAAKTAYEAVRLNASGTLAAESTYYKAYFEHKESNYDAAIATVQSLTKNYAGFKLWTSKGLVVMGKSYNAQGQTLNATTILQYVVDSFAQYPEVVASAQAELNAIKADVAKTNSSVVPTGK